MKVFENKKNNIRNGKRNCDMKHILYIQATKTNLLQKNAQ